ncbi:putative protein kinase Group-Pl-2 family [Helianthus annuus]|nr:putative protein kinase Group-Pl-2 family [Helianthus annuus]
MNNQLVLSCAPEQLSDLKIADCELSTRSWSLFAVLLSIGRPVSPIELASRCRSVEMSTEFVEFVCSLPNSPVELNTDGFVTVSSAVCRDLQRFLVNSSGGLKFLLCSEMMRECVRKRVWENVEVTYTRKRRRLWPNVYEKANPADLSMPFVIPNASAKVYVHVDEAVRSVIMNTGSITSNDDRMPSLIKFDAGNFNHGSSSKREDKNEISTILSMNGFRNISDESSLLGKSSTSCSQEDDNNKVISPVKACIDDGSKANNNSLEIQNIVPSTEEEKVVCERDHDNLLISKDIKCKDDCTMKNTDVELVSFDQKHVPEFTEKLEAIPKVTNFTAQTVSLKTNKGNNAGSVTELKYGKKDKRSIYTKQKLKPTCEQRMQTSGRESVKENKDKAPIVSVKGHSEPEEVPVFESYIVEEKEGSGGYGTVYKARRKKDGTMFAVKYPHVNANRQHVYNEVKMLERFGGKNFVIKYEGSFKSGNSHCLVLEHVAHDRPEVLKREIDVFQLRWYGYCLFRALASLHKQGVVHRDVKPGNFLFSRKASKGYLIDFNLATDLHQKLVSTGKSKSYDDASSKLVLPPHPEFLPPTRSSKYTSFKALAAETHSKMPLLPKISKKKKDPKYLNNTHGVMKSQGADGSGITSAKDATSSKVPSGERFREPIPCKGRQEYLNLVQEALQSPAHEATVTSTPVSKRKRVAAPPAKLDSKFLYLTPMPLQSIGGGLLKNKGDGKQKKEGPCVGTKGFRAPEVLLKSTYQGPKVDIWSAGVTLLYFLIGKTPFVGDPDQNIKEIAKLRGSEALWEVAKLHDRESSFPPELFQVQSLTSTKLQEWCKQNTRRLDFLEVIPNSFIDLVDKCLTVNPRSRISAEEALKHEFFVPCFNELEKQRMIRQKLAHSNSQHVNSQSSSVKNFC